MTDTGSEKTWPVKAARGSAAVFSNDLSHDFRTPLNIIIGYSELLLEEIPGKLNDEQRLDVTDILNSGRKLLRLVNTMLESLEEEQDNHPE